MMLNRQTRIAAAMGSIAPGLPDSYIAPRGQFALQYASLALLLF